VSGEGSELDRTLTAHLGDGSPLARLFDPSSPEGFLSTLNKTLDDELTAQREKIIGEFSLDNAEGALSRLVAELSERHGELGQALENRIDEVVAEFSLDHEDWLDRGRSAHRGAASGPPRVEGEIHGSVGRFESRGKQRATAEEADELCSDVRESLWPAVSARGHAPQPRVRRQAAVLLPSSVNCFVGMRQTSLTRGAVALGWSANRATRARSPWRRIENYNDMRDLRVRYW